MRKFESWQCQKCGAAIGWLGRTLWFLHRCPDEAPGEVNAPEG